MNESIAARVKALEKMTFAKLKNEWENAFGAPPPKRKRRVFLLNGLVEKLLFDQLPKLFPEEEAKIEEFGTRIRNTSTDWENLV